MQTFGDLWWVGRPNSETKIITNFKENPKSKIPSQAWRCRISKAMNVSFVQGPGSNRHHSYHSLPRSQVAKTQFGSSWACTSRRTWAFRLCSRLSRPKLCFGLSIFGVLSLFGCQLSGLKSMLVNCHRDCHEFGRCSTFAHLIFEFPGSLFGAKIHRFEVRVGWSRVQTARPSGVESSKSWLQWHLTDFVMIQCEEIPDFSRKFSWILLVQKNRGLQNFTNFNSSREDTLLKWWLNVVECC